MATLSPAARRRGLISVLIDTFFMWGGFFMVIPMISVHYVQDLGWNAALIGVVLAVRQLTQQGLTVFGGMLADRFGAKILICIGIAIRVVGFAMMAHATTFPLLMLSGVLAALGGALFDSPKSAAIAALTEPETRSRYYAIMGVVSGLGMTIGPAVGAWLLPYDFALVAYGATACFVVCLLISIFLLPPVRVAAQEGGMATQGLRMAVGDRPFVLFTAMLMGYWFMWVQMSISLPLVATTISGNESAVSWVYALNSGMSIVLQYPLVRLAERWLRHEQLLVVGVALMAVGLGLIALATTTAAVLGCVAVFSLGGLLVAPSQQTVMARLANPAALGSYFGFGSLALAFGGGLGNLAGGWLYTLGGQIALPALPWLTFFVVGALSAIGLALVGRAAPRPAAGQSGSA